jgi:proteic killer suppression protein
MEITFNDKKLAKIVNDDRKLEQKMGKVRAEKIRLRLNQLHDAGTLEDVRCLAGNYHELTDNRKGQWACDLNQPYRLIFTPHENPIPVNPHGQYIWIEIKGVKVIEIINYHKEK